MPSVRFLFHYILLACAFVFLCEGCTSSDTNVTSKKTNDNSVLIHQLGDADYLNPIISTSANASYIQLDIFQSLLDIDFNSLELKGQLAVDRPLVKDLSSGPYAGGMSLDFEIRPEAVWDNGTPITASDVAFTIKAIKNPKVNSGSQRPYFEFVDAIEADATNPKKFTVLSKKKYFMAEVSFGGLTIMPEYVYDPKGLLKEFSIAQLSNPQDTSRLGNNPKLKAFAEEFNSPKFSREKGFVVGSGPYSFEGWETGQSITLKRKANWWGDKVKDSGDVLQARPDKLVYKVITDWTTAVTSMKDEGLDVAYGIRNSDFIDLQKNNRFKKLYNLSSPTQLSYDYLGFNTKNPKFKDKKVRRALAHLVDKKEIIDVLLYGMGEGVIGPIHPTKPYYDKDLAPIEFDVDKAKALLKEAGWEDTDGNGIVDKEIDGQKTEMKFTLKYNQGNDRRKNICLLFRENARRAGVDVEVLVREWTVFLEENKRREFDMFCGGWVQSPQPDDLKQIWHTESDTPDGSNYVGFGTPESDKVIEEISVTLDENKRNELYKRIQEIIYDEQPYIFLVSPKERIAIHNRFEDTQVSIRRPGFNEKTFKLVPAATAAQ